MHESWLTGRGKLVIEGIASPAAGNGFTVSAGLNSRFRFLGLRCRFSTAVAVSVRRVAWSIVDGTNTGMFYMCNVSQVASLSYYYNFCVGLGFVDSLVVDNVIVPVSGGMDLNDDCYISISCNGIQAADQFSEIYWFREEWLEDKL